MEKNRPESLDSIVLFQNSQRIEGRGGLLHVTRSLVVFEVYNPYSIVQLSEVLQNLKIMRGERVIYAGRAVVSNLMSTGLMSLASATLVDPWSDLSGLLPNGAVREEVRRFVADWSTTHALRPGYQVAINNIHSFLAELSRWLGQVEVATDAEAPSPALQREFFLEVEDPAFPKIDELFGALETESRLVPPEEAPAHRAFAHRELHPLILCSPFVHRIYSKPLGYAGDFEMVNMILRDPVEGGNLYAKLINSYFLRKDTAAAHRNRIAMLEDRLRREVAPAASGGGAVRILNVGCGPAVEVQNFIRRSDLCERCEMTLLDFNAQTLAYAKTSIEQAMADARRKINITFVHKSIHDLLKEASRDAAGRTSAGPAATPYHMVYCAGLFDYLSDRVCSRLLQLFYNWTLPRGLVTATNVDPANSLRGFMDDVVEWHLIYRTQKQMAELAPKLGRQTVESDATGVNVFLDIRKSDRIAD